MPSPHDISRIPMPWQTIWREFRSRALPPLVFGLALAGVVPLWPGVMSDTTERASFGASDDCEAIHERILNANATVERQTSGAALAQDRSTAEVFE